MLKMSFLFVFIICSAVASVSAHGSMHDKSHVQDKRHLNAHLQGMVDLDQASQEELRFHYFTSHDVEDNGKLDGCELMQSLLHFHSEGSAVYAYERRAFSDAELSMMVDHVLLTDDKNFDGLIDYCEFVSGQISRGF